MDDPKEKKNEEKNNYTRQLLIWGGVVIVFWLFYSSLLFWGHCILPIPDSLAQHKDTIGVFGDYFGALNALFAGLAFAGLIVTIRQQSADLKATKDEMQNQTAQFAKQTELIQKQIAKQEENFREQRYFNLITRLDKIRSETDARYNAKSFLNIIISIERISFLKDLGSNVKEADIAPILRRFSNYFSAWEFVYLQMFEVLMVIGTDKGLGEWEKKVLALRVRNGFAQADIQILAMLSRIGDTKNPHREEFRDIENIVVESFSRQNMIEYFVNKGKVILPKDVNISDEKILEMTMHFVHILETFNFYAICSEIQQMSRP